MIEAKFQEHKLRDDTKYFNYIVKRELYEIGTFKVEWMHVTHSIIRLMWTCNPDKGGNCYPYCSILRLDHTPTRWLYTTGPT